MISKCLKCGKKFTFTPIGGYIRRYCSAQCAHSHTHSGPKPHALWKLGVKCLVCGELFTSKNPQKYCSPRCRSIGRLRSLEPLDMNFIKRRIKIDPKTGCWIWQKSINGTGYGDFSYRGKYHLVHRFVYQLVKGKLHKGLVVRHKPECHNTACCNPDHLVSGTHKDNYYDSIEQHQAASKKLRGKPSGNGIPIVIDNIRYLSIDQAAKKLKISWKSAKGRSK